MGAGALSTDGRERERYGSKYQEELGYHGFAMRGGEETVT